MEKRLMLLSRPSDDAHLTRIKKPRYDVAQHRQSETGSNGDVDTTDNTKRFQLRPAQWSQLPSSGTTVDLSNVPRAIPTKDLVVQAPTSLIKYHDKLSAHPFNCPEYKYRSEFTEHPPEVILMPPFPPFGPVPDSFVTTKHTVERINLETGMSETIDGIEINSLSAFTKSYQANARPGLIKITINVRVLHKLCACPGKYMRLRYTIVIWRT